MPTLIEKLDSLSPVGIMLVATEFEPGKKWTIFGRLINWWTGSPIKHCMIYLGNGMVASQRWRLEVKPLVEAYPGATIRYYYKSSLTEKQRQRIRWRATLAKGRTYDWLGATVGQALGKLPLVGRWLREHVQFIGSSYCPEHTVTSTRAGDPEFPPDISPQDDPGKIDEALAAEDSGYELFQFEVPEIEEI